jgi:hypothetical protein
MNIMLLIYLLNVKLLRKPEYMLARIFHRIVRVLHFYITFMSLA